MSDIAFTMTSDEKDVVRGLQAVGKATGAVREQIMDLTAASKAAGAADNQLSQQRLAALTPILEKQKQLKAAVADLEKQLKEGKITADQYKESFEGIAKESNTLTTELKQLQAQVNEDTADLKKAGTIIGQTEDKTQKYSRAVAELDRLKQKGILSSKQHAAAIAAESVKLSETGEAADKSGGFISGLTGKMAGFVAGLGSVSTVIAVLKAEYDALIERQGKSRDANLDLAGAQSGAIDNLDATMTPQAFAARMRKESQDLGMNEKDLTVAAGSALSAKGDKSASEAIDAVVASAKLNRFDAASLPTMSGSALDLGKHLNMKPEEALGFLLGVQQTGRTVSMKGVAENIAPGIIGGVNMGFSKENASAVSASISGTAVDPMGATTGTTMSALFQQLREFGSAEKGFTGGAEHQKKQEALDAQHVAEKAALKERFDRQQIAMSQATFQNPAAKAEHKRQLDAQEVQMRAQLKAQQTAQQEQLAGSMPNVSPQEMMSRIQADPELRKTFFRDKKDGGFGATFERKMQSSVEQLLTPGTQGFKDYQNALKTQQQMNPQQMFDNAVAAKNAMPAIQLATKDQKFGNVVNQMQLGDESGAMSAIVRSRIGEIRESMGRSRIGNKLDAVKDDFRAGGKQSLETAIATIEGMRNSVDSDEKRSAKWDFHSRGGNLRTEAGKAQFEKEFSESEAGKQQTLLQALIDELKGMRTDQQQKAHAGIVANRARDREGN